MLHSPFMLVVLSHLRSVSLMHLGERMRQLSLLTEKDFSASGSVVSSWLCMTKPSSISVGPEWNSQSECNMVVFLV